MSTFFRLIWAIPIVIALTLLTAAGGETVVAQTGEGIRLPHSRSPTPPIERATDLQPLAS
ncbi:MAG: hypothetical protein M3313_02095 [Actinomycetota bacterium]|nr:hypothetical protein [Actinomycetota bacterium]